MSELKTAVKKTSTLSPANLYDLAHRAGHEAVRNATVVPMTVGTPINPFSTTIDKSRPVYNVEGGVCGFAEIIIRPARGKFVSWLKKNGIGRSRYGGGYTINVFEFGQSMQRKEEYAYAFSAVLREHGIHAYGSSRMD